MAVEKELIRGINAMMNGKEEGFNILYSYTYNYVYGRAKLIMKNEDDALDLTQETFIQAYKGIHTLENAHNVYAWLGSIVYRQGMRIYRKKKKEFLVDEEAEGIFEDIVSEDKEARPEESAEADATAKIVMDMINELPELQRAAIMAFYYDNMKIDDIAEVFECSSNTIKSRLNYAKKTLKEKVEAHEKENRYKLHSLTPAVLLLACKSLFTEKEYMLAAETAQNVYNGTCGMVGFAPKTISSSANSSAASTTGSTFAAEGTTTGATVTAGTTTATGTASTAGTIATGAAAKTGMAFGTKILIGVAAVLTTGVVGVGAATATGNLDLGNMFQQEVVEEDEEDADDENDVVIEETEEESAVEFESYAEAVAFIQTDEYLVESADYLEEAKLIMEAVTNYEVLEANQAQDMVNLSEEKKDWLNFSLLYHGLYSEIPAVEEIEFYGSFIYENETFSNYMAAYYEGGSAVEADYAYLSKEDGQTIFGLSDSAEWVYCDTYTIYQYNDYLLIQAPCYWSYVDNEGPANYLYTASALFKITENELYPVQLVHVTTTKDSSVRGDSIGESVLLWEGTYKAKSDNEGYELIISNLQDYGTYQTFDMQLLITHMSNGMYQGSAKYITCNTVTLEGNKAHFECDEEIYYERVNIQMDEIVGNNGFYGEFTIQEDGSLVLTYGVTNDTDGWDLNTCSAPITFTQN